MSSITFKKNGEQLTLDVNLRGRPRKGETSDEARARKIKEAKKNA